MTNAPNSHQPTDSGKARESVCDVSAAINAIILESGFDDATRPALMAALDAASGRVLPFPIADKYLGRRMTRHSSIAVEHGGREVEDRAHAQRWLRGWKLIDSEQARTGFRFVERRRGGLRGESRETMKRFASTYTVPLVQIVVDVIRRARAYRSRFGAKRIEMFQRAAREILDACPKDYQREGATIPQGSGKRANTSDADAAATRIFKAHARIVSRANSELGTSDEDAFSACLTPLAQMKETFGTRFDRAIYSFTEGDGDESPPACITSIVVGSTRHDEPDFPPFEPADGDAPRDEVHAHELFSKSNVYAGENESSVTRVCIVEPSDDGEIDPVEAAEAAAIQAEGCELSEISDKLTAPPITTREHKRTVATEALHYASVLGWRVFPLHTPVDENICSCGKADCQNVGKHPIASLAPRGFKDATNDGARAAEWWRARPDANIGIATGAASGLLVIDVDPRHDGWESLEELFKRIGEVFPPTVEAITGSDGRHFYFRMPDADIRNSVGRLGKGLDVRANGGYVVAAPSVHASGNRYRWASEELPLADVPYGVLKELIVKPRVAFGDFARDTETKHKWTGGAIPEGRRNETLFKRAAALRGQGADENAIIDALCDINNSCSPPLPLREIEKIAASAIRYEPNARGIFA